MATLWVQRRGNSLMPDGAESHAVFSKLPFGKSLRVEIKQPRNGAHHRLFWVLCTRIADAIGAEPENVSDVLKIRTGHVTKINTKQGLYELPKSISFASLDQQGFSDFFNRCVTVIETEWGIARSDVLDAVSDLLHPERAA